MSISTVTLIFDGKSFPVPKKSVFELVEHLGSLEVKSYTVESCVPAAVFGSFAESLKNQTKISVTPGNAVPVWSLAKEFFLPDLAAECETFAVPVDQFSSLCDRVSSLERQIVSFSTPGAKIDDVSFIEAQEEGLETLRLSLRRLETSVEGELNQLKGSLERLQPKSTPPPSPKPAPSRTEVEIPMPAANSLKGIIRYLMGTVEGGNVHEKGIVTLTSKSPGAQRHALRNVANLADGLDFRSADEPGQWVCWDFHEMRVRLARYTLKCLGARSWVVEGSLDRVTWTEVDRQTNTACFQSDFWPAASFPVSTPMECRFIRLTQTDTNHGGNNMVFLEAVEFFGTLYK
jgi:hypothetical protein